MTNKSLTVNEYSHMHSSDFRQSFNMQLYNANILLSLDSNSNMHILKNRYRETNKEYEISIENAIDIIAEILVEYIFKGRIKLFKEGLKAELIKSINKTIKEGVVT